jgi:hypothetical protein
MSAKLTVYANYDSAIRNQLIFIDLIHQFEYFSTCTVDPGQEDWVGHQPLSDCCAVI